MPRTPGKPRSKIRKKIDDILSPPKDRDLADVQTSDADYARNKSGKYRGPETRQRTIPPAG